MYILFRSKYHVHLIKDFFVVVVSIIAAIILAKSKIVYYTVGISDELRVIETFIAGIFFTSVATIAPAGVVLAEIAKTSSIFWTAFFGALGSVLGDLIIFKFVRDRISEDLAYLLKQIPSHRVKAIFKERMFRWVWPLIGAIIIASPLPDELGIAMLGLSKMKYRYFFAISFVLSFVGIYILGWVIKY